MSVAIKAPSMEEIKRIWEPLTRCGTKEEARAYGMSLPREKRWLLGGIPQHNLPFVKNPDGTFLPDEGVNGNNAVRIRYSDTVNEATVEDSKEVYAQIFAIMSKALLEAERQNKPLHFHVGEWHLEREAGLLSVIALKVANRLGIHHIGVESRQEDSILRGKQWPGINNWGKRVANEKGEIPDKHPDAVAIGGFTQNRHVLVPEARKNPKNVIFATDDAREGSSGSHPNEWAFRETEMVKEIKKETRGEHTVHFCGGGHLYGLQQNTPGDVFYQGMKTEQNVYLQPPGEEDVAPEEDPNRLKGKLVDADRPLLNGVVSSLEKARALAVAADNELGARLADDFFRQHPDLAPKGTLESLIAGGRVERKNVVTKGKA